MTRIQTAARHLDRFPVIRSRDISEIEDLLKATYGARRFQPGATVRALKVHANHWASDAIAISYCEYGAAVEVQFPGAEFYRQQFTIHGSSSILVDGRLREIAANRFCSVPPRSDLAIQFRPGFEQLVLRVNEKFLDAKFSAIYGVTRKPPMDLHERMVSPALTRLGRLLGLLCDELDQSHITDVEIREMEQAIAVSFLAANMDQTYAAASQRDPGNAPLRTVEDYIAAKWNSAITIEDLASVTGISGRSLFHHFRKRHGVTPMAYVKDLRLLHAHTMLATQKSLSVTDVALACGFGNLGHFAAAYRKRFGELPSETLRTRRR